MLDGRMRGSVGGIICLCQRDDEGASRESSAVHLLASGGNTLTLALPISTPTSPARFMTYRVTPGLLGLRTFVSLVLVAGYTCLCVCTC